MSDAPSRHVRLFGTETAEPEPRRLETGRLTVELDGGGLRYIRHGGVEVMRAVDYLLRDSNWATVPPRLENLLIHEDGDGFLLSYTGHVDVGGVTYSYDARIEGTPSGLSFEVEGAPSADLATNRTGFVLLHPIEGVAGTPLTVTHVDGMAEETRFPALISPGQPVFAIRGLGHEPAPGLELACRLEAELPHDADGKFEMEDQRNWSDASYKTYVASLLDGFPYTLPAGRRLRQSVRLEVTGAPRTAADAGGAEGLRLGAPGTALPRFGIGAGAGTDALDATASEALAGLGLRHLVAYAELDDPDLSGTLAGHAALARTMAAPVQLELVLPAEHAPEVELARAAEACAAAGLAPEAVIACPRALLKSYQPSGPWPELPPLGAFYAAARQAFPKARIGGGMLSYFTELNRYWPPGDAIDFVSHTTSPIVHAADDRSVMETVEALPAMALTVRERLPGTPHRIGPSALAMRHNPYGADTLANPTNARLAMAAQDPRQRGLFAAAWTLAYAARLADAGLEALALNHVAGASGILAGPAGWPQPWFDDAPDARVRPVFHTMRWLARTSARPHVPLEGLPEGIAGLAFAEGQSHRLLLANTTNAAIELTLPGAATARVLDAAAFVEACRDPAWSEAAGESVGGALALDAYATAIVSVEGASS